MKQLLCDFRSGEIALADIPCPQLLPGHLLIRTRYSLISPGTERMLVDFGKSSYFQKARQQPEKVRQVIDKIKTDGFRTTWNAVKAKLDDLIPLGYCNVGEVIAVAPDVTEFHLGDFVVSNGSHSEIVLCSRRLCAKIPPSVDVKEASATVLASIGLQGIRLANPTLGETFCVIGLGAIGLLTVQLLRQNGCQVIGLDFNEQRLAIAKRYGAHVINLNADQNPVQTVLNLTDGIGADATLITASTESNDPVEQAARMSRKRGRIVLVGVVGLKLNRSDFYEKELSFSVSCSYGPGRYDSSYEINGQDYPIGFVRWTEQRNFQAVLQLLADGKLDISSLITHQFSFEKTQHAYQLLEKDKSALGILLEYSSEKLNEDLLKSSSVQFRPRDPAKDLKISVIGAGNYARQVLIPNFKKTKAELVTLVSAGGRSAAQYAKKFGFSSASTSVEECLCNDETNSVVIATRHDSHAELVLKALEAGKHVFVEKPLCLTMRELEQLEECYEKHTHQLLMVGYNRRYSPHIVFLKKELDSIQTPKSFVVTVNAGSIPLQHWTQDLCKGGGRLLGEGCHFIDLLRFLTGHRVVNWQVSQLKHPVINAGHDNFSIHLEFADGSLGVINYLSQGHASYPKEKIQVFAQGCVYDLDNFRLLQGFGSKNIKKFKTRSQDKGHAQCAYNFVEAIRQGTCSPIPVHEIFEVMRLTIQINEQLFSVSSPSGEILSSETMSEGTCEVIPEAFIF